jgi:transcriptional regulator with XRE-family HTH domain
MNEVLERNEKRATIQDIARLTGVSVATVSGAFSGKRRMSVQTREAVLKAAHELGFEPNPHAQRLRNGGCANTVGLLSDMDLGVATLTSWEIRHRLDERNFTIDDHILPIYVHRWKRAKPKFYGTCVDRTLRPFYFLMKIWTPASPGILEKYVEGGGVWSIGRPRVQIQKQYI